MEVYKMYNRNDSSKKQQREMRHTKPIKQRKIMQKRLVADVTIHTRKKVVNKNE